MNLNIINYIDYILSIFIFIFLYLHKSISIVNFIRFQIFFLLMCKFVLKLLIQNENNE